MFKHKMCNQIRLSFNTLLPQLKPLPIMDLDYCWSLDFVGPLIIILHRAKYILVMVEHFSK